MDKDMKNLQKTGLNIKSPPQINWQKYQQILQEVDLYMWKFQMMPLCLTKL